MEKNNISKFERRHQWQNNLVSPAPSLASMSNLLKSLAAFLAVIAYILWPFHHAGSLYGTEYAANTLNSAAYVGNSTPGATKIDVTLLFCVFVNDAVNGFILSYDNVFGRHRDKNVLCVRKTLNSGWYVGDQNGIVFGRFSLMETAKGAKVVRWPITDQVFSDMISGKNKWSTDEIKQQILMYK